MNKKLIFIIVGVLLLVAVVWFMFLRPKPPPPDLTGDPGPKAGFGEAFVVKLKDDSYIKIGLAAQLSMDPKDALAIAPDPQTKQPVLIGDYMPDARDAVIGILTDTTTDEIRTPGGQEAFKKNLLKELKKRFKKAEPPIHPVNVLITEFSLQ